MGKKKTCCFATGKHRMRKACGNEDVIPRRILDGSGCPSWRARSSRFEKEKLFSWLCSSHAMLGHTQVLASPRYQVTQNTLTSTMLNAQCSNVSISNVQYQHIFFFTRNPQYPKTPCSIEKLWYPNEHRKNSQPRKKCCHFFWANNKKIQRSNPHARRKQGNKDRKRKRPWRRVSPPLMTGESEKCSGAHRSVLYVCSAEQRKLVTKEKYTRK